MPSPAYITIKGATQGDITKDGNTAKSIGNSYQTPHQDELQVLEFKTGVFLARDPQSGQPTGQRIHKSAEFVTPFSKASPLLWQAIAQGEVLQIKVVFFRPAVAGKLEHYFTIAYTDCILVDGDATVPHQLDPEFKDYPHVENWKFTYRAVDWTHDIAGTSGADDWQKL